MNCHLRSVAFLFCVVSFTVLNVASDAQAVRNPQKTAVIDQGQRVSLPGHIHPLARAEYDRGPVSDSFPVERTLLLLSRPPDREAALRDFLTEVHRQGSANYHQWLTPAEFGRRFGPAHSDVLKVTQWLSSQGFRVAGTSKGRQFIEFSGTAAQLRSAFRAEIHEYNVNGERHYANAREISLPAALAPLVRGVAQLHDFRAQSFVHSAGAALYSPATKRSTPLWTIPNPFGGASPNAYPLAPEDFATQYDLGPLYQAGINGTGQTIGIINESNIDLSLVAAYQQLFGLPGNPTQVVIDGEDPGTLSGVDIEAYLDVEVSGAVAPNATVNLYIARAGGLQDPLALAAIRAIEDNQAGVLSVSFGQCEQYLGNAGNQFWSGLWQQAAAQGQTVFVSSGDFGAYCIPIFASPAVNGLASTPWNVAVGGTDFYYSDYATGGASIATLWNQTNDTHLGSLKAPLPEQAWSDPFGLDILSNGAIVNEFFAGGGGPSSCSTQNTSINACTGGNAKPSWQNGAGVPADGVRDTPDVSLFASNGANLSAYPVCALPGDCVVQSGSPSTIFLVGGTSASSPAMAGIMALVNQKYGRQGQANFTLYQLAQQKPAVFHDVTLGSNFTICDPNFPGCVNGISTLYPATPGYDLASGLGSVDANLLVSDWNSITLTPTTTTLNLSATKITHGAPVAVTTSVTPSSGSGTPTGNVAILTAVSLAGNQAQTSLLLTGGKGSGSINYFPGGYYNVTSAYHGDGTFGASTSTPVALQVAPENSNINFLVLNGFAPNPVAITNGGSVPYDSPLTFTIQPTGASAAAGKTNGNATGAATFKLDSTSATVPLNSTGVATWVPPALAVGSHTASASYSGDASFNASTGTAVTFNGTQGQVFLSDRLIGPYTPGFIGITLNVGDSLTVGVQAQGASTFAANPGEIPLGTAAPTGTIQVCLSTQINFSNPNCSNNAPYVQTVSLSPLSGNKSFMSVGSATFPNLAAGTYSPVLIYGGDINWGSYGLIDLTQIGVAAVPHLAATTTSVNISPTSISGTQPATITATVVGSGHPSTAPSGEVDFYVDNQFLTYVLLSSTVAGASNTVSFLINPNSFLNNGSNSLMAVYHGDAAFDPSVSNTANFTSTQTAGDFTLLAQQPQLTMNAASSSSVGLNLRSLSSFNGNVTLSCLPSSTKISCSVAPSPLALNGAGTVNLTVTATAGAASLRAANRSPVPWFLGLILPAMFWLGAQQPGKIRRRLPVSFLVTALVALSACGGGGSLPPVVQPPKSFSTYSVLVVATSDSGIIHNARVNVVVQ